MKTIRILKSLLRRAGLSVTRYPGPHTVAWNLARVLERYPVDLAVDVGAHHGEFASALRRDVRYSGRIVSFEPDPIAFAELERNLGADPRWTGHCLALGGTRQVQVLHRSEGTDFSSLLEARAHGLERFPPLRQTGSIDVEVERLDTFLGDDAAHLILKVDTQGYDLQVLSGSEGILDRVEAIVVELSVTPIYQGQPGLLEAMTALEGWGFEPIALVPLSRQCDRVRVVEFDGVFVRTKDRSSPSPGSGTS